MIHERILDFEPLQFEQGTISVEVDTIEILYRVHKLCRFCNGNLCITVQLCKLMF